MADRALSICFVAPNAYPILAREEDKPLVGGAELQQVLVARGLAERGHDVSMICLDFGQSDGVVIDGVRVYKAFKPDAGIPMLRFVWPRLTGLWRSMTRADADVYYSRTAGILPGLAVVFCQRRSRKSIFAAAGTPDLERNTPRVRYSRDRKIYEYGLRRVDRILVQNEEQHRLCRANFGREAIIVPNYYAFEAENGREAGTDVLWVSTIRKVKRPELYLDLAALLPEYRFKMIGGPDDNDPNLFEEILARAAELDNVEFLGFIPYSRIGEYFDDARVFVNTSDSEGFPNTFLQAWSRRVPTVSFVDCGARYQGALLGRQVDSLGEMADCVINWLQQEEKRSREGERCRAYMQENHSPDAVLDLYETLLSDLVLTDG